jgi:hypothetical protein
MTHTEHYDVVVVGGGAAGSAAAVGASRMGARTLLVERYGFLGGAATNAQVLAYCGFFVSADTPVRSVAGVGLDLLSELNKLGFDTSARKSKNGWIVALDPEAVKLAFDRLVLAAKVELSLHSFLVGAHRKGDHLQAMTVADHRGLRDIEAACFVDASGEATLSTHAGVPLSQAGSLGAKLQPASMPLRVGGVPLDVPFDRERLSELIAQHNLNASLKIPRADGGFLMRLPNTHDVWWMVIDLLTDGLSGPDLSRAETLARERAHCYLEVLKKLPGFENAYLLSTGPQIGIRESRRPFSRGDVTMDDGLQGRRRSDGIARASWPMEVHDAPGCVRYRAIGGDGFFDIPHSAIEAQGLSNLRLAGRVIGSDPTAYGSVRVMGTAFATGHAAGVSAALQADGQAPDAAAVRRALVSQNAIL